MALLLVLHVIGIGALLHFMPLRIYTVLGSLAYFVCVYLIAGHYLAAHPDSIAPRLTLDDDYYRNPKKKKISPFAIPSLEKDATRDSLSREEIEKEHERVDEARRSRLKEQQIQTDYPSTNP